MAEMTMKIESPELTAAINRLADMLAGTQKEAPKVAIPEAPKVAIPTIPVQAVPVAPASPEAPVPATVPIAPTAAPTYSVEQLCEAAGRLMDKGQEAVKQLQGLLAKYQVGRVSNLPAELLGAFATDLRGLGVQI